MADVGCRGVRHYEFAERLAWSEGFLDGGVARILRDRIPGCYAVEKATEDSDRAGTDYWALRRNLPPLSIDVKVRSRDWAERGQDDLALETWSVMGARPGWTRDDGKHTDYVLWYWADTSRFVLVSFPALCRVFRRYWEEWREQFKVAAQSSEGWQSECVFVPRELVMEKLRAWVNGKAA
jgi:hypothetical protein